MDLTQLNDLELSNIGEWPMPIKAVIVALACAGVGFAWYWFDTKDQWTSLEREQAAEIELRAQFEAKQQKAANIDAYRQQLEEMKETFGAMLRQLPDRTEVAALLVDVSQTGLAAGLRFELFQPQGESLKEFYAELPISIKVTGTYHEFGHFISGLAALPRIVTIHDVNIEDPGARGKDATGARPLALKATVKTYRYLDEEVIQ